MTTPRLGVASIRVSISDADGFRVTHGTTGETIFHKEAEVCIDNEWNEMFNLFHNMLGDNQLR